MSRAGLVWRSVAVWVLAGGAVGLGAEEEKPGPKPAPEPRVVEVVGKVQAGMMGIGGEHTGIELTSDDKTVYELSARARRGADVESFDGKRVRVKGVLRIVDGTERTGRRVIAVTEIEVVGEKGAEKAEGRGEERAR